MRKIIHVVLLSQLISSCFLMPLGAPHTHHSVNINPSDSLQKLKVFCTPHHKVYVISGTKESDSVYISSSKMKKNKNHCSEKISLVKLLNHFQYELEIVVFIEIF